MLTFIRVVFLLLLSAVCGAAWPAQEFSGHLSGSFTGAASDGSGNYSGAVEGTWNAAGTSDAAGVFIETVGGSGSFGGAGIAGTWSMVGYDPQTKSISVTWNAAGGRGPVSGAAGTADGTTTLVVDTASGVATGGFQGQVYTAQGVKTINGTWTVRFQGAADTVVTGRVQGSFGGSASYVGAVNGTVSGDWTVRVMPDGSVAGTASGSYDGGSIAVQGYTICICGTWLANVVRGSDGQFRLEGSWTHPVVSGTLDGRGGGPIVWYIDTSTSPMQAGGNFDGSVGFSVAIPLLGTQTVPVSVGGTWNATLPLNP